MRDYIAAALTSDGVSASIQSFTFDAGQTFEVRANGRTARVSAEWGDNPESVVALIRERLGLALPPNGLAKVEPGCATCAAGTPVPHTPSRLCRSGKRPHCTCNACF